MAACYRPEFDALNVPFGLPSERCDQLQGALHAFRTSWPRPDIGTADSTAKLSSDGGRPLPLLVGGEGEKRTLPAAVAYADVINWQVGSSEFTRKSRVLAQLSEAAGRDPASLRRTHAPNFQLFESEREFRRWRQGEQRGMSAAKVQSYIHNRGALYGTASGIEATLEEFVDAGCGGFMIFCNASPAMHSLDQLASIPMIANALPNPGPERD